MMNHPQRQRTKNRDNDSTNKSACTVLVAHTCACDSQRGYFNADITANVASSSTAVTSELTQICFTIPPTPTFVAFFSFYRHNAPPGPLPPPPSPPTRPCTTSHQTPLIIPAIVKQNQLCYLECFFSYSIITSGWGRQEAAHRWDLELRAALPGSTQGRKTCLCLKKTYFLSLFFLFTPICFSFCLFIYFSSSHSAQSTNTIPALGLSTPHFLFHLSYETWHQCRKYWMDPSLLLLTEWSACRKKKEKNTERE